MSQSRTRLIGVAVIVVALVLTVFALQTCNSDDPSNGDAASDADSSTTDSGGQTDANEPEDTGGETGMELHVSDVEVVGNETAVITTNKGVIKFEFFAEDAPNTVATFIELADMEYFDGIKFHRVEPNFVIQTGDPLSRSDDPMVGTGGPEFDGTRWFLAQEFNQRPHLDGSVAMARSADVNSAGSQFYITMGPQPALDGQYTVFGQVTEGLDIVYQIGVGDIMEAVRIERDQ